MTFAKGSWALILGGSSGFGLATAHKLAAHGMNLCLVHRDRRGAMSRIEPEFEKLRGTGVELRHAATTTRSTPSGAPRSSTSSRGRSAATAACACCSTRSPSGT